MNIFELLYEDFKFDKNKPINLFEAFSGIGTQAMALKRLGLNINHVGISEIDKHALQSYESIHGQVKNYGGIGSFDKFPPNIDICTWSFPCQDISLAGTQGGMVEGSRSNYGYVFLDTIENTPYHERPKVLLMENVKALLSEKFSEDWKEINLRLERLGYKNYAESLIATDFGVPQTRDRVFIVSIKGEYSYTFPKPFKLQKKLSDYLETKVDEKYYLNDSQTKYILGNAINKDLKDMIDRKNAVFNKKTAYTITTKQNRRIGDSNFILGDGLEEVKVKEYLQAVTKDVSEKFLKIPEATKLGYSKAYDGDGIYLDRPHQKRGVVQSKKIPTLKTSGNDIGVVVNEKHLKIRKLTPLETWRLMGISDEDFFKAKNSGVSDSQLYKQAGNAIVVDVLYYIFKEMLK